MMNITFLQKTLKALADPTRREILEMLKKGEMAAGEIAGISRSREQLFHATSPSSRKPI